MGALDAAMTTLRGKLGAISGVRGTGGPQSASPSVTPWVVVRADRGTGVLGALEVVSHRVKVFVLVADMGGGDDWANYDLALSFLDPVLDVLRADGAAGNEIVESPFDYLIGKLSYGGTEFWALTLDVGIETKEETAS